MEGMVQMTLLCEVAFTPEARPLQIGRILQQRTNLAYCAKIEKRVYDERAVKSRIGGLETTVSGIRDQSPAMRVSWGEIDKRFNHCECSVNPGIRIITFRDHDA